MLINTYNFFSKPWPEQTKQVFSLIFFILQKSTHLIINWIRNYYKKFVSIWNNFKRTRFGDENFPSDQGMAFYELIKTNDELFDVTTSREAY